MAGMAPERSRNLHNFSLPPRLNWGSQRLFRCSKLNNNNNNTSSNNFTSSNHDVSFPDRKRRKVSFRSPPSPPSQPSSSIRDGADNHQIGVMREKLMYDLCSEVDQIRTNFLGNSEFAPPPPSESHPWNLRTRRSPATSEVTPPIAAAVVSASVNGERAKFSVPLSRQEIEVDFVRMSGGKRPPRKPKKRPRSVQKYLDNFYPGLWLEEITADMYKVHENPELAK